MKTINQPLRQVLTVAIKRGIPVPSFSSAIAYYDSYRTETLPANLFQAQRDYFGAHTYQRKDKEGISTQTGWNNINGEPWHTFAGVFFVGELDGN